MFQIEEDAYQEDLGFSVGAIGKSNSGRIRRAPVDSKTKARISKTLQVSFLYIAYFFFLLLEKSIPPINIYERAVLNR